MSRLSAIHRKVRRRIAKILGRLPTTWLQDSLAEIATHRARALSPADGLRFLFGLEAALYPIHGELAVAYGGGVHTKHRHMHYHDFFANRIRAGERVLDIGCGIGAVAYDIAEKVGVEVVGIDLSEDNIAVARQRFAHPRVCYMVGDVLRSLPGEHFDVVILSNLLEHLPGRPAFLRRIVRAVQPSRLLIRVPLFERDWRVPLKQELGVEWRLDSTHETEYTLESFTEEMEAVGLEITHLEVRWGEIWSEVCPNA